MFQTDQACSKTLNAMRERQLKLAEKESAPKKEPVGSIDDVPGFN
ncbi:hypothetical protein ABES25_09980 [Bacillus gobiensis]